jgi:hypothetical protein
LCPEDKLFKINKRFLPVCRWGSGDDCGRTSLMNSFKHAMQLVLYYAIMKMARKWK